jgi:hypothetical protein
MPLSADALKRINARHARYGAILVARVKALDARYDAACGLPTREAQAAALAHHERRQGSSGNALNGTTSAPGA